MLRARRAVAVLLTVGFLWAGASGEAAKVKVWQQHQQSHFDKAQFKDAIVTSEGALRLSRKVNMLANLQATNVWDVVEDPSGNLFVATGDEGKLWKVAPDGVASVVYASSDSQILCLAQGADGAVYAGTGPGGKVLRVTADGARVLTDELDSYVWGLVYDPDSKALFAGTGPKGRIYRIAADGKVSVHYQTKQEHILSLAAGPKGTLYAGTDKGGLVYRIDGKNKGFVLYHAHQSEVRSLVVTADAVYAGTSSPTRRPVPGGKTTTTMDRRQETGDRSQELGDGESAPFLGASTSFVALAQGAPAPSTPVVGDNSVYRIAHDGTVREIFRDKVLILRLLANAGKLLVATGMHGQFFEVDEATKEKSEIARLDNGQIHCILKRHDGSIVLGAGDPGKLYVLENRYAAKGTITSDVLDAKILSKWGVITWKAQRPTGASVSVAVRSGNVSDPDETWSDWSAEQTNPQEARAGAPTARYLQYRVTLTTQDARVTPEFRQFVLRYKTTNQAPEITSLDVPDLEAGNVDNPRKLKIRWNATDPNEDELTYRLYFRKDGWKDWVLLEDDLEKKDYDWDTTTVPSGIYQIKVTASDRRDNAPEEALTAERISAPVPVAHMAPSVTLRVMGFDGDRAVLEASATDPLVRLTEASFAVNGKRWANIFPVDGLFDSKTESFRIKTEALRPGTYVLMLRVKDAAGNVGSSDVLFTMPERK
ncbi:MAG TPA: hypothetical protein VNX28_09540 [Gemmataceae bacterium]|nr:hypothetical protein [Gemmataceae bacterium]